MVDSAWCFQHDLQVQIFDEGRIGRAQNSNLQSKAYRNNEPPTRRLVSTEAKRRLGNHPKWGTARRNNECLNRILRQCKFYQDINPLVKHAKDDLNLDIHSLSYIHQERNGLIKLTSTTQNEYSFSIGYLSRIISIIFDIQPDLWNYKWGETKLGASKEEKNRAKNDDDKRSVGSSIEGIIYSPKLNLDLLLLEVSGPMHKEYYTHFLKNYLKIAKNLKNILKNQFRKSFVLTEARNVNVFGLHTYRNTFRLYCMSMPLLNFYYFSEVIKFDIPVQPVSYAKELPLYIKNPMKMLIS
ncbi:hypothetical protein PS15p_205092 [Mucor circinelloides]